MTKEGNIMATGELVLKNGYIEEEIEAVEKKELPKWTSIEDSLDILGESLAYEAKKVYENKQISTIEKFRSLLEIRELLASGKANDEELASQVNAALLDVDKVPPLLGDGPRARAFECLEVVVRSKIPLYLLGDSGSGKTATMQAILSGYSKKFQVPAYYFQLSREDTKTTILLGHRLIKGSLKVVPGILATAALQPNGAIVGVDEITHSTHSILTLLNAFDGDNSVITIGDRAISAHKVKVIYGSNLSNLAGNIRVPPSFANRLISKRFDHPNFKDEFVIAKDVARRNYVKTRGQNDEIVVPDGVGQFITGFVREIREQHKWPLSARNIAHGIILCQLAPTIKKDVDIARNKVDRHFNRLTSAEPLRVLIAKRILNKEEKDVKDVSILQDPLIMSFIEFVSKIGVIRFKEILLQAINFDVDIEGLDVLDENVRNKIQSSIL